MDKIFSERLKSERERLKLDQEQMASAGGVKKRTYCYYESGERCPDAAFMAAIAAAGADVLWIITGDMVAAQERAPYGAILKQDEAALLDNYRHCSEEARAALRATGAALAQQPDGAGKKRGI